MEGLTLALDASTYDGSVAIFRDGVLVVEDMIAMRGVNEERLMPAVVRALDTMRAHPRDIARLVCGAGPGSFTSLRIAAAIAKGIASGTGAPVFAVSSLALAAVEAGNGTWLVALDALRADSYAACFEWNGSVLCERTAPEIVANSTLDARANAIGARVIMASPRARAVGPLLHSIVAAGAVDLASWEPDYGRRAEAQVKWEAAHGTPLVP